MSQNVAPWLQGLDEVWEPPQSEADVDVVDISSSSPAATSLSGTTRKQNRSLSGLPAVMRNQSSPQGTTRFVRSPLAPINNSRSNTLRQNNGTTKLEGTRSVSVASDACGTVQIQPRAKSASPKKQQETLEWQRRLVRGQVAYGDQTDLFGPSGLENIFAPSSGPGEKAPKAKGRMQWMQQHETPMPSSPPVWRKDVSEHHETPSDGKNTDESAVIDFADQGAAHKSLATSDQEEDGSLRSNPFDLQCTDELERKVKQIESSEASIALGHSDALSSGNGTLEQEDFSPVFISKHTTINGMVNYAAFDSHLLKEYNSMKASQKQASPADQEEEEQQNDVPDESSFVDGPSSVSPYAARDLSLSENLPTGTPPVASLGKHVELTRGGYSAYGSFKKRLLSPSPSKVEDSLKPDATRLSPIMSDGCAPDDDAQNVPTTPMRPQTPSPAKSRSSGSPLKLFGAHDTFTNNRLLRRLSQLDPADNSPIENQGSNTPHSCNRLQSEKNRLVSHASSCNSFGSGQLDQHHFEAEITITNASDSDQDQSDRSPGSEVLVPGSRAPHAFKFDQSPNVKDTFKAKRKPLNHSVGRSKPSNEMNVPSSISSLLNHPQIHVPEVDDLLNRETITKTLETGKRPPNSPVKDSTPKRRRTLHASEMEDDFAAANQTFQSQIKEVTSSRKRKDARHGENQIAASPDVLAQRKIIQPRTFTPNQERQQRIEAQVKEAAEEFASREPEKLEAVMEQIEESMSGDAPPTVQQQAETVAAEVAAYSLRVTKPSGEHSEMGDRKRSVTTQDFFNEAVMVMNLIRAKARRQSGLGSVEESDESRQSDPADDSMLGGQSLRISRPPSRESGPSGWRQPMQRQNDARVVSHLRRFQEKDDTEFIAESLRSLQMDEEEEEFYRQEYVIDEHSNIRITGPPSDKQRHSREVDTMGPASQRSDGYTLQSQNSEGLSTGRTAATNCSKSSDNVGTLAPDAVAHLIGEQVGVMTFDKEKKCWVRVKSPEKKPTTGFLEPPSQISSDDDPFQEISDLPVDEQMEMRRVSATSQNRIPPSQSTTASELKTNGTTNEKAEPITSTHVRANSAETVISRPVTRDNSHIRHMHSSSVPSRYTAFASSQQEKVETRATSWSDEELARMTAIGKARNQPLQYAAAQAALLQRRDQSALSEKSTLRPTDESYLDEEETEELHLEDETGYTFSPETQGDFCEDTVPEMQEPSIEAIRSPKLRQSHIATTAPPTPYYQGGGRPFSLRKKTLTNKFQAEVRREESELSLIAALPGDRVMSLSLSVSRPISARHGLNRIQDVHSPSHRGTSFILSDLPDFTVHEEDHERPSERALAARLAQHAAAEVDDRYALAVKDIIRTLTDVQEDEPYWEYVKQLDLRNRSLGSLFGLEDFCSRVQEMDVSGNSLTHMEGAPSTIRRIVARSNLLSSLSSWATLPNLQYLDISNNSLDSLKAIGSLVHLRELHADDNEITSLDGVLELDGLMKLRLRRNKLTAVDLGDSDLHQLVEIDLCGNQIASVAGLEEVKSLTTLRLDNNPLSSGFAISEKMPQMETLSLQKCQLETLDVMLLPKLRNLMVDDNRLTDVQNIERLKSLDLLSMRRQGEVAEGDTISVFDHPLEARTVLLSGNSIPTLNLTHSFLNLHHLELASVGLHSIPDDFGLRMPNLRTLNLNFNSLLDVRPLLNIQRLSQLSLCGNRVHRLRKSVATFAKMTGLQSLDLRDNPITQGFYLPATTSQMGIVRKDGDMGQDEDQHAAEMEEAKHRLPRGDRDQDVHHWERLDEETKLRRRVYELLISNNCHSLEDLDGLVFDRSRTAVKDGVFERLVELGILRKSNGTMRLS